MCASQVIRGGQPRRIHSINSSRLQRVRRPKRTGRGTCPCECRCHQLVLQTPQSSAASRAPRSSALGNGLEERTACDALTADVFGFSRDIQVSWRAAPAVTSVMHSSRPHFRCRLRASPPARRTPGNPNRDALRFRLRLCLSPEGSPAPRSGRASFRWRTAYHTRRSAVHPTFSTTRLAIRPTQAGLSGWGRVALTLAPTFPLSDRTGSHSCSVTRYDWIS